MVRRGPPLPGSPSSRRSTSIASTWWPHNPPRRVPDTRRWRGCSFDQVMNPPAKPLGEDLRVMSRDTVDSRVKPVAGGGFRVRWLPRSVAFGGGSGIGGCRRRPSPAALNADEGIHLPATSYWSRTIEGDTVRSLTGDIGANVQALRDLPAVIPALKRLGHFLQKTVCIENVFCYPGNALVTQTTARDYGYSR